MANFPLLRQPARRRLRTFAFDPMSTRLSGRFLTVDIPFEHPLAPGPIGELVEVIDYDPVRGIWYQPVDLDDPAALAQDGLQPSESDPRTHQQSVYAVSMSVIERFERFVGRRFRWRAGSKLKIVPHAFEGRNAYFDPGPFAVLCGYFQADERDPGANLPGQVMFTSLSVDIVAHEVTHAIVHRLREYYSEATNPDVVAWHEAAADLVALFHHFAFPEVVSQAVASSRGELRDGSALLDLAAEFGQSTGRGAALRSAIGSPRTPEAFVNSSEPHERGACFVAAVFDAYLDTFTDQIADLRRLASGGTGVLPVGALPPDLVARVTTEAIANADRILGMVVRAFDFLPVVDVTFGDVVRAIITADRLLFPDDAMHLRSNLVESLRRRGIYPTGVASLAEESVGWQPPDIPLNLSDRGSNVNLGNLILDSTMALDPGVFGSPTDTAGVGNRTAGSLAKWAKTYAYELGLDPGYSDPKKKAKNPPIALRGVHVAYLQAADRQPRPVIVLQFAQRHNELEDERLAPGNRAAMRAGTTVIARVDGQVLYVITKPLPLVDPDALATVPEQVRAAALKYHKAGEARLEAIQRFGDDVAWADAFAAWTIEPATRRLTFARMHAHETGE